MEAGCTVTFSVQGHEGSSKKIKTAHVRFTKIEAQARNVADYSTVLAFYWTVTNR